MLLSLIEWYYGIDWHRIRRGAGEVGVVLLAYIALACAVTWPTIAHLDEVILGGGELGGWMWRIWWHSEEVDAIGQTDLGLIDRLSMLFSLGRYPETGNILDILLLSYPLESLFGSVVGHNLKVLLILVGNGICGYALARSLTNARLVSLAAGALAIVNPIVIQDINKTGPCPRGTKVARTGSSSSSSSSSRSAAILSRLQKAVLSPFALAAVRRRWAAVLLTAAPPMA